MGLSDVDLRYISALARTGIRYVERYLVERPGCCWTRGAGIDRLHAHVAVTERGVGKAIAEGKERLCAIMFVAPIADEHAFFVHNAVSARFGIVAVVNWIVFPPSLKCCRKTARRIYVAKKNLCSSLSSFLSRVPNLQQSGCTIDPRIHVHAAPGSKHDDGILVRREHLLNEFILPGRESEGAVRAFALRLRIKA